jgi:hypothetical protein
MDISELIQEGGKIMGKKAIEVVTEITTKEIMKNVGKFFDGFQKNREKKALKKEVEVVLKQELDNKIKGMN